MSHHLLERLEAAFGMADLHHLDLVELVLADHAPRVAAGAARLRAEARRVRSELDRQARLHEHLLADAVGERDLGGRDQVLLRVGATVAARLGVAAPKYPEHVIPELRQ